MPARWRPADAALVNSESSPTPTDGPIADLVLAYVSTGRDFRNTGDSAEPNTPTYDTPPQPQGYVIRAIPLDQKLQPILLPAELTILMYPTQLATIHPLRTWHVEAAQSSMHWIRSSLLDGFLLRLDWGQPPPGPGVYRLALRMTYENKKAKQTIYRDILFEDKW